MGRKHFERKCSDCAYFLPGAKACAWLRKVVTPWWVKPAGLAIIQIALIAEYPDEAEYCRCYEDRE